MKDIKKQNNSINLQIDTEGLNKIYTIYHKQNLILTLP